MTKEFISGRQAVCIIVLFLFGSSVVLGINVSAGQDSWIALLLAMALSIPLVLMYARITKLLPEKDLYEIIEELFGKWFGKILILLITWYAIHLCTLVLRNFSEFIQITAMPETPQLPLMILMLAATSYLVISGIETFGRWTIIALPLILLVVVFTFILSINHMDVENFLPIMEHNFSDVLNTSFQLFSFPFAELILFLTLSASLKKNENPYKIYLYSIILGTLVLSIIFFRNLTVMGTIIMERSYFPSYEEARMISMGNIIERIEGSISYNFVLAGMVKITVCLFASAKGIAKIFNIENYKHLIVPTSLLILAFCSTVYSNVVELTNFIKVYPYYAFPFQVIIPVMIWLTAEAKKPKKQNKQVVYAKKQKQASYHNR